jgi:hypothetical protein
MLVMAIIPLTRSNVHASGMNSEGRDLASELTPATSDSGRGKHVLGGRVKLGFGSLGTVDAGTAAIAAGGMQTFGCGFASPQVEGKL